MTTPMNIEVCYALPDRQIIVPIKLDDGATVAMAIAKANILLKFPQIDLAKNRVGIFGKLAKLDSVLREGDRVEIYRQLIADPKEARRKRAAEKNKKD